MVVLLISDRDMAIIPDREEYEASKSTFGIASSRERAFLLMAARKGAQPASAVEIAQFKKKSAAALRSVGRPCLGFGTHCQSPFKG